MTLTTNIRQSVPMKLSYTIASTISKALRRSRIHAVSVAMSDGIYFGEEKALVYVNSGDRRFRITVEEVPNVNSLED